MKKIKILLVGYGSRGKVWSRVIKKNIKTTLVGICDINQNLKIKNSKKIPFFYKINQALSNVEADAVVLSTPPFNRMKDLKICAKYKLPVLVEKPLSVNLKEAKLLIDFMNHHKLLLFVGLNFRYWYLFY